jgi:glycosyltransferase involved in cell wall biosynthesis
MRREQFDLVHVHTPVAAFIGRLAARMARVPVVIYTAHGFYFHERMPPLVNEVFVQAERIAARIGTDFLFTQSEEDRETAVRRKFLPQERLLTIGNGVDVRNQFDPRRFSDASRRAKRAELGLADDEIAILFLGRLVREKGIFDLLAAFERRQQRRAKLLLIGDCPKSERDRHSAAQLSRLLAGGSDVLPLGVRHDVPELLHASDIFVLPSYREGMPRSIIEAMAMAKPVVATNIRGCREEVVDGETGFLVEVGDVVALSQRLDQLIADRDLRQRLGHSARRRAEVHFDEQQVIDRQIAVIERLLGTQPTAG